MFGSVWCTKASNRRLLSGCCQDADALRVCRIALSLISSDSSNFRSAARNCVLDNERRIMTYSCNVPSIYTKRNHNCDLRPSTIATVAVGRQAATTLGDKIGLDSICVL